MFGIQEMTYSRNFRETVQDAFGGMDRRAAAPDGALYRSLNMCAGRYPALTVRPRRGHHATVTKPNGFLARDCVAWVSGGTLVVDGAEAAELTEGLKLMVGIQKKICIWPDKVIYDRQTGQLTRMEASWEGNATFSDGSYAGEPAMANTITVAGDLSNLLQPGDGLAVTAEGKTYGAFVVQEVEYRSAEQKTQLRFLEETWRMILEEGEGMPQTVTRSVKIQRRAPDLEGVFEHNNRLWGWHGGSICCCRLGDPTNWESFNADATDSWELEVGSPGDITGGVSYGGRPVFFKENRIIRVYGDYPAQFSIVETESLGVEAGSGNSLAIAGDTLYYKSTQGIVAYAGGYPYAVGEVFGEARYRNAVAGSDGVRYYVSMQDADGTYGVYCFDTRYRVWHEENGMAFLACGWDGELYAMEERGRGSGSHVGTVHVLGDPRSKGQYQEDMLTRVEFADITEGTGRKKTLSRLVLRLEADAGTELDISVQYDSSGEWIKVKRLVGATTKGQTEVIIPLRRCDHYRIRIDGSCEAHSGWTLYSKTRERCIGSNRK